MAYLPGELQPNILLAFCLLMVSNASDDNIHVRGESISPKQEIRYHIVYLVRGHQSRYAAVSAVCEMLLFVPFQCYHWNDGLHQQAIQ